MRVELRIGHALEDEPDLRGLLRGDLVAGQHVPLRALEPHPVDPHRGRRRAPHAGGRVAEARDRKSTRLNSSHVASSYAVFCLKKKNKTNTSIYIYKKQTQKRQ